MRRFIKLLKIALSEFESFSWPVKIRVRADFPLPAPRKSPVFPASVSSAIRPGMVLRVLDLPTTRPSSRRASSRVYWRKAQS